METHGFRTLLILFLGGMLSLHLVVAWNARDLVRKGYPDFTSFYAAGKIVREGLGRELYDDQTQFRVQQEFAAGVSIRQGPLPYIHSPFEAVLFVPLSALPYLAAYLLWDLVGLLILLALPFLLRPHLPMLRQTPAGFWLFAAVAFYPAFFALLQGQDIFLLLLLLALTFVSFKNQAEFAAGCWLGLGLFRFHVVLPLVLILLWQKRGRAILGFLVAAFSVGLISIAVVGWHGALAYPAHVWQAEQMMERQKTVAPLSMPTLRGLLDSLLIPAVSRRWSDTVVALVSLVLILFAASKWTTSRAAEFNLGFSLCVIVTVLVAYHAFAYDLSLLLLPIALVVNHVREDGTIPVRHRLLLLAPIFLLFFSPLQMFLTLRSGPFNLMALVLLLWVWGVAREIRQRSPSEQRHAA
jgi:hypothetical protein